MNVIFSHLRRTASRTLLIVAMVVSMTALGSFATAANVAHAHAEADASATPHCPSMQGDAVDNHPDLNSHNEQLDCCAEQCACPLAIGSLALWLPSYVANRFIQPQVVADFPPVQRLVSQFRQDLLRPPI
jgi:hypothetical protein